VGLGGEIRSVGHIEKRIQEAEKLGFKLVIIPKNNAKNVKKGGFVKIVVVETLMEAVNKAFK
jgi:DNA repair protein RadA/Sms